MEKTEKEIREKNQIDMLIIMGYFMVLGLLAFFSGFHTEGLVGITLMCGVVFACYAYGLWDLGRAETPSEEASEGEKDGKDKLGKENPV